MARVLVIDDSPTAVAFVHQVLEAEGHEVRGLENFVDLAAELRRFPPDVVFLDLEMPGLSGRTTGTFLRKFEAQPTALVIYSSRPREELEEVAKQLRASAVVEKGSNEDHIRTVVQMLVADRNVVSPPTSRGGQV